MSQAGELRLHREIGTLESLKRGDMTVSMAEKRLDAQAWMEIVSGEKFAAAGFNDRR